MRMRSLPFVGLVAVASCCTTFDFRGRQQSYNDAVLRGDSAAHGEILAELTPEYIATLDPKLQPNAWMIRAVAAWQARDYLEAKQSAEQGEPLAPEGSRDRIVLKSIEGLIAASEAFDRWHSGEPDQALYEQIESELATAWRELDEAARAANDATPVEVVDWVRYQQAVLTHDWASLISELRTRAPPDEWQAIRDRAKDVLGDGPQAVSDRLREQLSPNSPLRALLTP